MQRISLRFLHFCGLGGDQSLVLNIWENARAEDDVKEFKYSQLEFVVCIFYHFSFHSTPQAFLGWRVCILSCSSFNVIGESSGFWSSLMEDSKICI